MSHPSSEEGTTPGGSSLAVPANAPTSSAGLTPTSAMSTSSHNSARSNASSKSRVPTLSELAAHMKLDAPTSGTSSAYSTNDAAPARGRLGLTGRLNSSSAALAPGDDVQDVHSADEGSNERVPAMLAHGEPPSSSSRSSSPTKRPATVRPSGSGGSARGLPSLQEIRERMSKKGLQTAGGAARGETPSGSPTEEVSEETALGVDGPAAGASKPAKAAAVGSDSVSKSAEAKASSVAEDTKDLSKAKAEPSSTKPETEAAKAASSKAAPKDHPLQHKWTLYFDSKTFNPSSQASTLATGHTADGPGTPGAALPGASENPISPLPPTPNTANIQSWEDTLKMLGVYKTVEGFMNVFATLRRPSQLERNCNYHLFKSGIKPMWEDPANASGGKWVLTLRGTSGALLDRSWMWLVLALIGEELDDANHITGAVVSTRSKGDRITLWIRNKDDVDLVNRLGKKLVHLLDIEHEPGVSLEFTLNSGPGPANAAAQANRYVHFSNAPPPPMPAFSPAGNSAGPGGYNRGPPPPGHGPPGPGPQQGPPGSYAPPRNVPFGAPPPPGGPGSAQYLSGGPPAGSPPLGHPGPALGGNAGFVLPRRGSETGHIGHGPGNVASAANGGGGSPKKAFASLQRHGAPHSMQGPSGGVTNIPGGGAGLGLGLGGPIGRTPSPSPAAGGALGTSPSNRTGVLHGRQPPTMGQLGSGAGIGRHAGPARGA
ncbi:Translation initiation factor 4F, cap-binding subunit (eIF-4E) and related cap-binding proteins [Ceraceosorus bombacis]|uniref:Translation initiation factor 4F, cap-binding subunit (EIF-4E) and related cap-binding proteins n=1 Tax=Ceraceosorus bombacis TaxID=401625 RepID=A0A0P1BLZ9_9BASI|nr:Translation initiation factor 4F, cap-binding subunit (eIF-4E) and related cap-binding proteins [Ceraceosorus bombacis]